VAATGDDDDTGVDAFPECGVEVVRRLDDLGEDRVIHTAASCREGAHDALRLATEIFVAGEQQLAQRRRNGALVAPVGELLDEERHPLAAFETARERSALASVPMSPVS